MRQYIAEKIGEEYLIPLVGGPWNSAEEIDFDALPEQFVLKCNHDSGGIVFCRDRENFDYEKARAYLSKRLKRNHWRLCREWPYKNIKPCIMAEKYMEDSSSVNLNVYKFLCFDGTVEHVDGSSRPLTISLTSLTTPSWGESEEIVSEDGKRNFNALKLRFGAVKVAFTEVNGTTVPYIEDDIVLPALQVRTIFVPEYKADGYIAKSKDWAVVAE